MKEFTWKYQIIDKDGLFYSGELISEKPASEICLFLEEKQGEVLSLTRVVEIPAFNFDFKFLDPIITKVIPKRRAIYA